MAAESSISLDLPRQRDLQGRGKAPWVRRLVLALFLAVIVVALSGVFGQRAGKVAVAGNSAKLELSTPSRLRGGLYYQALIAVHARQTLQHPQLVLNRGWFDGLTINTITPQPSDASNTGNGGVALQYSQIKAGDTLRVYFEYQVNPTTVTHRLQSVELDDGGHEVANLHHHLTIFP